MPVWLKAIFNKTTIVLYLFGVIALAVGLYIGPSRDSVPTWIGNALRVLEPLGYSIIITTLVASVLNYSFQVLIENRFAIVKGAEGAQVRRLYALREDALSKVDQEAQRANRAIDILCIAGTDILQPKTAVLQEIGRRFQDRSGVKVRILILDPRSRYAVERSLREEGEDFPPNNPSQFNYTNKKLCFDTLLALRQVQMIIEESSKNNPSPFELTVRLYNAAPMMLYIALDNLIFVEQYHLGVPRQQAQSPFTRCLGKAVPMIEVLASSELGYVLRDHFEYLWKRSEDREMRVGSYEKIVSSLESNVWLKKLLDLDAQDQSDLNISTP